MNTLIKNKYDGWVNSEYYINDTLEYHYHTHFSKNLSQKIMYGRCIEELHLQHVQTLLTSS